MRSRRARLAADARRRRFGQIAIGLLLVVLMVFSIVGYGVGNNPQRVADSRFEMTDEGFVLKETGMLLHAIPLERTDEGQIMQNFLGTIVRVSPEADVAPLLTDAQYIATTFDPSTPQPDIQFVELARFSMQQALPNVFSGILAPSQNYPAVQTVTCASAEPTYPVVQMIVTNETLGATITRNGSCVTIAGDAQGVLAAKDWILLTVTGNA